MHELLGLTERALVVTGVRDDAKGERLVVLHTLEAAQLSALLEKLRGSDLPNMWRPKSNSFFGVESIPVLGTGKLDITRVKRTAEALAG